MVGLKEFRIPISTVANATTSSTPISHYWYRTKPGHCLNTDTFLLGSGAVNTILDFLVIMLPIPLLWRLKTTASQKGVLTGIFICAGFVCIISIIRLVVLSRLTSVDVTWNYVDSAIWSAAEPSMGVISACLPSLRPLVSILLRGTVRGLGVSKYGLGSSATGKLGSSNGSGSRSGRWGSRSDGAGAAGVGRGLGVGGGEGKNGGDFEEFFRMDAPSDPGSRKVGHRVDVRGGRPRPDGGENGRLENGVGGGVGEEDEISLEAVNPPEGVIRIKNEVTVTSSDWLEYKDKVY
ncbi:uncharacterized protein KY384_009247 [Bacidia gigantensis]|uniref:uncharacterized protein n=1 Tax=Bacidia gigantensis TaxID=2732470 RepID=UPI001D0429EB|nr:uncharacterized protein KY384_009247 [Bacidia gigantensis]KAG8525603.1 hypothetical protein KY384_009247 [Bacidia gigantensis]